MLGGCSRGKYYLQADREVNALLKEKSCDPRWEVPFDYNVRSDKRSRFYDPYNQIIFGEVTDKVKQLETQIVKVKFKIYLQ